MHQRTDNLPHVVVLGALLSILAIGSVAAQVVDTTSLLTLTSTASDSTFTASPIRSGPHEIWRVGLHVDAGLDHHLADGMTGLPDVPNCCDGFFTGSGTTWYVGLLAELPILENDLFIGWRLGISMADGGLERTIEEEVNADRRLVLGRFVHTVTATHTSANLDFYLNYRVLGQASVRLGMLGGYRLATEHTQEERLEHPEGVVYPNGRRTRLEFSGPVAIAQPLGVAAAAGLRYDIPIVRDHSWQISPEVVGYYGLTPLLEESSWRMVGLYAGIALQKVHVLIPDLAESELDVIFPIRSTPRGSLGTEADDDTETTPESGAGPR